MKKLAIVLLAVAGLFIGSHSAFAVPVSFTDVYISGAYLNYENDVVNYTHSIITDGFNPATDTLSDATITFGFMDDSLEDPQETVRIRIMDDGAFLADNWEVDTGLFSYSVDVDYLQQDGELNVRVRRQSGDFYLFGSCLTANGDRAAVPEPATMALLGTGLIGLIGLKRRK